MATKASHVPDVILFANSIEPALFCTFHMYPAVDEFKSGLDISVNVAPVASQVANN